MLFSDVPEIYGLPPDSEQGGVFLGPIDWSPDLPLPPWWGSVNDSEPVIYVTLGSSGAGELLLPLQEGLRQLDAQVIVSTAGAPLPHTGHKLFFADYLPGAVAAARADLVICNGGSPTSYQALLHGAPVLGIPGNLDQYLNMHYLEKSGLGLALRGTQLAPAAVAAAASRLMGDNGYRSAAQAFAQRATLYECKDRLRSALQRLLPDL